MIQAGKYSLKVKMGEICGSLGAIWNFSEGRGLPLPDTRLWGMKGPVFKA